MHFENCNFSWGTDSLIEPLADPCYTCGMYGRPVTQTDRLNMRLPPDLKRRLDRLAVTRDFEMRPLSIVAREALECGLEVLEARAAIVDSE